MVGRDCAALAGPVASGRMIALPRVDAGAASLLRRAIWHNDGRLEGVLETAE